MKFRLLENVLTTVHHEDGTYFIYVNPKSQELNSKEDSKGNRAILDPQGNLYMEARYIEPGDNDKWSDMIHCDLIEDLHEEGKILNFPSEDWWAEKETLKYGLCLQRRGNRNSFQFYIAESYGEWIYDKKNGKKINSYFTKAKAKNSFLKFSMKAIYEI